MINVAIEGFGIIPKVIMKSSLSIEAKALYAYIASHVGGGIEGYPKSDHIIKDLKLSRDRFDELLEELISSGFIDKDNNYGK